MDGIGLSAAQIGHILAEVRQGGRKDALRFALGCNQKHGLRRSNADKRRAVEMALTEFGNLSDRLLAQMCGVVVQTVGNIRHQLSILDSSPRTGRDGRTRAVPLRGTNGTARPEAGVSAVLTRQMAGDGGSHVEVGNPAFIEVADAMAGLEEMVEALAHDHPEKTAAVASMIAKVRADLLRLENHVRSREVR